MTITCWDILWELLYFLIAANCAIRVHDKQYGWATFYFLATLHVLALKNTF